MEEGRAVTPLPATLEPISRPSSASTTASAAIAQLPGITALAASATSSPQLKTASAPVPTSTPTPPAASTQAETQAETQAQVETQAQAQAETQAQAQVQPTATSLPTPIVAASPASAPAVASAPVAMSSHIISSPAAHAPTPSGNLPTCQNCSTSTTPLWRRDEMGSVLCNACGLFLKLHGRPRPISLKTDVIKSRNRVKTMRPDMQKKKQSLPAAASSNGNNFQSPDAANAAATAAALAAVRATQQKGANGHGSTDSPISRTGTPNVYDPSLTAFQAIDHFPHESLHYPLPGASPGRAASPNNGEPPSLDAPQTHEQLIAANSSLKTRVSELDLINELYRGRLQQLEQDNQTADNYRHSAEMSAKEAATERAHREEIQRQLDDSHRRENILKRRLDEMEQELQELKSQLNESEFDEPAAKKLKLEEPNSEETEQLAALQSAS
ncbi:hypothetical protein F5Y19DRAFT_407197 [Xylariaceae sp. FL1651]|nr:hypothetical protein F5Y19DRAFT_407197 [Xylariaceae sp. FL1651]